MPLRLPATSIHQRINPFELNALPASPYIGYVGYVGVSSRACNQPPSLTPSPSLSTSSRFTNKLFVLQFEHPSPRFLCVAQRQADCSKPVAMAAVRGKSEGKGNPSFFYPLFFIRPPLPTPSLNTRISTHREFNPRAFRERRRFLLGNSALFRSDCERPPPYLSSRWDERTSVFCHAFQFAPSFPHPGTPRLVHRELQRFRDARVLFLRRLPVALLDR